MKEREAFSLRNEFLLHLRCTDVTVQDKLFLNLIKDETFGATLLSKKVFADENKVAYRLKISAAGLIQFKKKFDDLIKYESLELFEYKEW